MSTNLSFVILHTVQQESFQFKCLPYPSNIWTPDARIYIRPEQIAMVEECEVQTKPSDGTEDSPVFRVISKINRGGRFGDSIWVWEQPSRVMQLLHSAFNQTGDILTYTYGENGDYIAFCPDMKRYRGED